MKQCRQPVSPETWGMVQYGDSVSVLVGLFNTYGAVSINRIHVLLEA